MTTQPEALRLADALEQMPGYDFDKNYCEAAAELRRLHAENESLRQIVNDFPPVEAELREVSDRAHRLEAQRDALLEALKLARPYISTYTLDGYHAEVKADAAIKAVEGENT